MRIKSQLSRSSGRTHTILMLHWGNWWMRLNHLDKDNCSHYLLQNKETPKHKDWLLATPCGSTHIVPKLHKYICSYTDLIRDFWPTANQVSASGIWYFLKERLAQSNQLKSRQSRKLHVYLFCCRAGSICLQTSFRRPLCGHVSYFFNIHCIEAVSISTTSNCLHPHLLWIQPGVFEHYENTVIVCWNTSCHNLFSWKSIFHLGLGQKKACQNEPRNTSTSHFETMQDVYKWERERERACSSVCPVLFIQDVWELAWFSLSHSMGPVPFCHLKQNVLPPCWGQHS